MAAWAVRAGLVGAGLAPFLPALLADIPGLRSLAGPLAAWFRFQCERDPERMLALGAVCARCLGLYVGLGSGALVARPRLRSPRHELWLALSALAMLLDVASEWAGLRPASALVRLVTGLALGYPAGVAVVAGFSTWARSSTPTPTVVTQNPS
ncbi:MAG TPA: DUF2085 domain-containing protein [Polyangiaceae bacterium]|jgi:uncharacterized membrane protein|nr:DUF2085 domain-containing protein [Polyangiaceae bacterium]